MSKRVSNKPSPRTGARSGRTNRIARYRRFIWRERKRIREKIDREVRERQERRDPKPKQPTLMDRAKRLFRQRIP